MEALSIKGDGGSEPYRYEPLPSARSIRVLKLRSSSKRSKNEEPTTDSKSEASTDDSGACRLQSIQCSLVALSLDEEARYSAMSYVWGDPNNRTTIYIDGHPIQVTVNLEAALRDLRSPDGHRLIWADAVCINQADLDERAAQVQMMADIYRRASTVYVWLGPALSAQDLGGNDSVTAYMEKSLRLFRTTPKNAPLGEMEGVRRFTEESLARQDRNEATFFEHDWKPYKKIMSLPWFTRKWVFQEVVLAARPRVMVGSEKFAFQWLGELCKTLSLGFLAYLDVKEEALKVAIFNCAVMFDWRGKLHNKDDLHLVDLIFSARWLNCYEPRDHIYALMGLASDCPAGLRVDYTRTSADSFADLARLQLVGCRDLNLLSIGYNTEAGDNLPSWVPNLAAIRPNYAPLASITSPAYWAGGRNEPAVRLSDDGRTLFVTGVLLADRILALVPNLMELPSRQGSARGSDGEFVRYKEWFGRCLQLAMSSDKLPTKLDDIDPAVWTAFCYTMLCERTATGLRSPSELPVLVQRFCNSILMISRGSSKKRSRRPVPSAEDISAASAVEGTISTIATGRRFFKTDTGRLGQASLLAREGDHLFIPLGAQLPFVVRKLDDGSYTFVGDCYLNGMMDGQAFEGEGIEKQEIALK